ncbi:MAG TPA: hypothetical protein PLS11_16955, partial [Ottowia sp.]|nr:hypothetical protein [Ottowia sp.]
MLQRASTVRLNSVSQSVLFAVIFAATAGGDGGRQRGHPEKARKAGTDKTHCGSTPHSCVK